MKNKCISLLLTFLLCFSFPIVAFAGNENVELDNDKSIAQQEEFNINEEKMEPSDKDSAENKENVTKSVDPKGENKVADNELQKNSNSSNDSANKGNYPVYVYAKVTGDTSGLKINSDGWYTVGNLNVDNITNPDKFKSEKEYYKDTDDYNNVINSLNNIIRYNKNLNIDINSIEWRGLKLVTTGAADYVSSGNTWHLDGDVNVTNYGSVNYHYCYSGTTDEIPGLNQVLVTDEDGTVLNSSDYVKSAPEGYKYAGASEETTTIAKGNIKDVYIYYDVRNDLSYTVNYLEKETFNPIADQKIVGNQVYGSLVSEDAIEISGYENPFPTSATIEINVDNNVINFYYDKVNSPDPQPSPDPDPQPSPDNNSDNNNNSNNISNSHLPKTGDTENFIILGFGLLLMISSIGIFISKKKIEK